MVGRRQITFAVVAALAATLGVAPGYASSLRSDGVDLTWTEVRHYQQDPVAVSTAPHSSAVTLTTLDRRPGLRITRLNRHGHVSWTHVWQGPGGSVRRAVGRAVAVSASDRSVTVAGQAVCRFQGETVYYGAVFVRRYRLDGTREWTRWIGSCPTRADHRHTRALDVTGVAARGDEVAVTFTQGKSYDCCPHHRRGHVVVLDNGGELVWRKTLNFPGHRQSEVITADVTMVRSIMVVSGAVVRRQTGSDAFLLGLARDDGDGLWRHVVEGRSEPNVDEYRAVDSARNTVFAVGLRDDAFEGGGGQSFLERWTPRGERRWAARLPSSYASLVALRDHSALWSVPVWRRHHRDQLAFGRQAPGGAVAWRDRWTFPLAAYTYDYDFAGTARSGFSLGHVAEKEPARDYVQLWRWHW